jgi:hypothetical protein
MTRDDDHRYRFVHSRERWDGILVIARHVVDTKSEDALAADTILRLGGDERTPLLCGAIIAVAANARERAAQGLDPRDSDDPDGTDIVLENAPLGRAIATAKDLEESELTRGRRFVLPADIGTSEPVASINGISVVPCPECQAEIRKRAGQIG